MTIKQSIKSHFTNRLCCRILRIDPYPNYSGYILDFSKDFIVIQESDEFDILGYVIIPINTIEKIRFNKNDKYYDKIIKWEGKDKLILKKHNIDLNNYNSIFKSIRKTGLNVIIENEVEGDSTFDIGPIMKVTPKAVYINYFNAIGFLDEELTRIAWSKITLIQFDDQYTNTFTKYLRRRKPKKKLRK